VTVWGVVRLEDVADITSGGTPRKSEGRFWDGDIPWISGASMHALTATSSERRVTEAAIGSGTRLAPSGSSLVLVRGMSLLEEIRVSHVVRPVAFNQDVKALSPKPSLDPWFFTYALLASRDRLQKAVHQAGHGTGVLSTERLTDLEIPLPPLDEQRRIAEVLCALDDLIDTNSRLISLLVALFDAASRRVALQTSSSEILGSKAALTKGVSYKGKFLSTDGLPLINLASFSRSGSFVERGTKYYTGPVPSKKLLSRGDIVVANTDLTQERLLLGRPMLVRHESASSTHHTFQVAVDDRLDRLWVYSLLRDEARRASLASFATGTTVTALPSDALHGLEVPWPSRPALREWAETTEPLLEIAWAIEDECETLRGTREELLPLLISGKVRVRPEEVSV